MCWRWTAATSPSCAAWRRVGFAERPRLFAAADVADPYGGSERDYERALDLIEAGCRELLATLTPFHAPLPLGGEAG